MSVGGRKNHQDDIPRPFEEDPEAMFAPIVERAKPIDAVALAVAALVALLGCQSEGATATASSAATTSIPPNSAALPQVTRAAPPPNSAIPRATLDDLDFESLPSIAAPPCSQGNRNGFRPSPANEWKRLLEPIQRGWHPGDGYAPAACIRSVRTRCAPDLDGTPGDEVLVEVSYRVPQVHWTDDGKEVHPSCTARDWVWDLTAIVALRPPVANTTDWAFRGVVGFAVRATGEGAREIRFRRFVRLPDGRAGVFARSLTPGFSEEDDVILVYDQDSWAWPVATSRRVVAAGR
jgi:hypothetical protein